jgi:hypothetical protein
MKGQLVAKLVAQFPTGSEPGAIPPRPPSAEPALPDAPETPWPRSVSRDEPEKLSPETKAHSFFVRTKRPELLSNVGVLELLAKCPVADDGEGVIIHRDVIFSLAYHLLDKLHELEETKKTAAAEEPRYDQRLSQVLDQLGTRDAEIKELHAALGEAAVKIRRLESKIFK